MAVLLPNFFYVIVLYIYSYRYEYRSWIFPEIRKYRYLLKKRPRHGIEEVYRRDGWKEFNYKTNLA